MITDCRWGRSRDLDSEVWSTRSAPTMASAVNPSTSTLLQIINSHLKLIVRIMECQTIYSMSPFGLAVSSSPSDRRNCLGWVAHAWEACASSVHRVLNDPNHKSFRRTWPQPTRPNRLSRLRNDKRADW